MEHVRAHFDEEAPYFDSEILKFVPHYHEMILTLVESLPFEQNEPINVADLGSGTGAISLLIKERYPNARITCVDLADNMIAEAKKKLAPYGDDIRFHKSDFYDYKFDEDYNAIVSSLALHHLYNDSDKKWFFQKIYTSLHFGGIVINADVVLGSGPITQKFYMNKWKQHLSKSFSQEQIDGEVMQHYYAEDNPAPLAEQLIWLKEIGFREVDVYWKYYGFAVYGGVKK